jgi:small GTP-binding protein
MTQPLKSKSKKICLMGASGVGKTSLVKRFIEGKFDETYRTTIGVHINKKCVICGVEQVELEIWDLEGKDDPRSEYSATYLGGAQGYMLVADVTRPDTLDVAKAFLSTIMRHRKEARVKNEGILAEVLEEDDPPVVLLLNKQDLPHASSVTERVKQTFGSEVEIFNTSAKLDEEVGQAFNCLVRQMLEVDRQESS